MLYRSGTYEQATYINVAAIHSFAPMVYNGLSHWHNARCRPLIGIRLGRIQAAHWSKIAHNNGLRMTIGTSTPGNREQTYFPVCVARYKPVGAQIKAQVLCGAASTSACGDRVVPPERAPMFWPLPDTTLLPCVLSDIFPFLDTSCHLWGVLSTVHFRVHHTCSTLNSNVECIALQGECSVTH